MNAEEIREYCISLKGASEDVKWESELCFCVDRKIFCLMSLADGATTVTFKVSPEKYDELAHADGFMPAPYLARAKWVTLKDRNGIDPSLVKAYLYESYQLVKAKLPKKHPL
jgi:predicted DNA-binding protein (MmcQ/YjbR family)